MLASYFPVLVFILVGLAAGVLFILLGTILGPKHHYAEKDAPYECGFEAFENAKDEVRRALLPRRHPLHPV